MSSKKEIDMDIEDILKARQTGASVSTSKVDSPEAAVGRLKAKIRQQITYWNNKEKIYQEIENVAKFNKSIDDDQHKKTAEVTTRSLWFKKKEMSDCWMIKLAIGTTPVYFSKDAKDHNSPWLDKNWTEDQIKDVFESILKAIEDGHKGTMEHIERTYNIYKTQQDISITKSGDTRKKKAKAKAEAES